MAYILKSQGKFEDIGSREKKSQNHWLPTKKYIKEKLSDKLSK